MDRLTTPDRPQDLVGSWVRLRDHDRPGRPYLGVLTRAEPVPGHPGLWQWTLRTPGGTRSGGPHLPAQTLQRHHARDVRRARRQLARVLARDRDLLARLHAYGDDPGVMPRVVAEWKYMRELLNDQLALTMHTELTP